MKNKLKSKYVILIVGVLVMADMWTVNKRYLNDDHFARKSKVKTPYQPTQADRIIYKAEGFDFKSYPHFPHFRGNGSVRSNRRVPRGVPPPTLPRASHMLAF